MSDWWSDPDDDPPELSQEVIDEIVRRYFANIQDDTPPASANGGEVPNQIQGLEECTGRKGCRGTIDNGGTSQRDVAGREEASVSLSESGLKDPQALEKVLELKETRQEQLTDTNPANDDDGEMAEEMGGSLAVSDVTSADDDGLMSKKDKGPKYRNLKKGNKNQRAQEKRVQTEQRENEKIYVPEERDIHLLCFLWWLEGYIKSRLLQP